MRSRYRLGAATVPLESNTTEYFVARIDTAVDQTDPDARGGSGAGGFRGCPVARRGVVRRRGRLVGDNRGGPGGHHASLEICVGFQIDVVEVVGSRRILLLQPLQRACGSSGDVQHGDAQLERRECELALKRKPRRDGGLRRRCRRRERQHLAAHDRCAEWVGFDHITVIAQQLADTRGVQLAQAPRGAPARAREPGPRGHRSRRLDVRHPAQCLDR